ncbi:MAG: DNA polymerase III subunit epsilon [Xanthomonadaceae bacterium]|nr:DNA polymerase III subunit epsilon [Xanthomonadaceae bacterium]
MRQIILDTETTGLEVSADHRIIEIGCIELVDRRLTDRRFHAFLNPGRAIDPGAIEVHGITDAFVADKPSFADVVDDFLKFVAGAELVIHNAPFDIGFINHELKRAGHALADICEHCQVLDTLALARRMHPGQRNSLDALCKRYEIDNSQRTLHGALLDAEILAEVYLSLTGGQAALSLGGATDTSRGGSGLELPRPVTRDGFVLAVVGPTDAEKAAHDELLEKLGPNALWPAITLPH